MTERIRAFLADLRERKIHVNPTEIDRRLARCRACGVWEACPKIEVSQWLPLLATGGIEQSAELCEGWKP